MFSSALHFGPGRTGHEWMTLYIASPARHILQKQPRDKPQPRLRHESGPADARLRWQAIAALRSSGSAAPAHRALSHTRPPQRVPTPFLPNAIFESPASLTRAPNPPHPPPWSQVLQPPTARSPLVHMPEGLEGIVARPVSDQGREGRERRLQGGGRRDLPPCPRALAPSRRRGLAGAADSSSAQAPSGPPHGPVLLPLTNNSAQSHSLAQLLSAPAPSFSPSPRISHCSPLASCQQTPTRLDSRSTQLADPAWPSLPPLPEATKPQPIMSSNRKPSMSYVDISFSA